MIFSTPVGGCEVFQYVQSCSLSDHITSTLLEVINISGEAHISLIGIPIELNMIVDG